MKNTSKTSTKLLSAVGAAVLLTGLPLTAAADPYDWTNASLNGTWDTTSANWTNTGSTWVNGNDAYFNGAGAAETVIVGENLSINKLQIGGFLGDAYSFDNTGASTIDFTGLGIVNGGGSHQIDNLGSINFLNSSSGAAGVTINNGGFVSLVGHTGSPVTLGTLNNTLGGGFGGNVNTASTTLALSNLTLDSSGPLSNTLNFDLTGGLGASGKITVGGVGSIFNGSSGSGGVNVTFTSVLPGPVAPGDYVLIDWTGATLDGTVNDVSLSDFYTNPAAFGLLGLTGASNLQVVGSTLVFHAVPEPATFAMPLAACLGLVMLRRRAASARVA
jgi:hypothetical protein